MKKIKVKYLVLSLVTILLIFVLIPIVFLFELNSLPYLNTNLDVSIQISLGDAMTFASVIVAIIVFLFERYGTAFGNEQKRLYGGALRLILKHIRDQPEPKTITEHWEIFIADVEGRKTYCKGEFSNMSLDEFTAEIYTLRFEGQIEITPGHQVVYRIPYEIKVTKFDEEGKKQMIQLLKSMIKENEDGYIREDAIRALSSIFDVEIVETLKQYLNDKDPRVKLEAAKGIIRLVSFPEN